MRKIRCMQAINQVLLEYGLIAEKPKNSELENIFHVITISDSVTTEMIANPLFKFKVIDLKNFNERDAYETDNVMGEEPIETIFVIGEAKLQVVFAYSRRLEGILNDLK